MDRALPTVVRSHACEKPSDLAFTFLRDGETESERLTFLQLYQEATRVAGWLRARKDAERAPVVLLYSNGSSFIVAFLACLYAGIIAVPAGVPRRRQTLDKLRGIVTNSGARLVLTESDLLPDISARFHNDSVLRSVTVCSTGTIEASADPFDEDVAALDSIAFLQYTSGSTGSPKGVVVSHRNIIANQRMICASFSQVTDHTFVGWLPFHHDMGLMATIIQPLFLGVPSALMPPTAFIQKPARWLRAISRYRATVSGGPNFAYDHCIRRCSDEELTGIDLSNWNVAFNGAEPIRAGTLERFMTRFRRFGFAAKSILPCYGMAEATLFVSSVASGGGAKAYMPKRGTAEELGVTGVDSESGRGAVVSCGFGRMDQQIVVVDPETSLECTPGTTGEVWLQGSNIALGYWNNEELTQTTFHAFIADTREGPFLRTGDLGFMHHSDLYVTGRMKDLIIVRGRNLYPHDIERTVAESDVALEGSAGAAVAVEIDGEEKLVVVHEVSRSHLGKISTTDIVASVRERLIDIHEVNLYDLVLVRPASIPKTSSGKIQRSLCAHMYRSGHFKQVAVEQHAAEFV